MTVTSVPPARPAVPSADYARLEERILTRDQLGASDVFYGLVKAGRPLTEMLGEVVRIHAPYTNVPYHQRLDDGVVRFVNNDHCLLSARATLRLSKMVSKDFNYLPLAQTIWYVPTGLDPWNQLLGKAPGHYVRANNLTLDQATAAPQVHWDDQEPLHLEGGSYQENLNHWLTLVQRGEVVQAYRVFLGLFEDVANRPRLLAQLMFAGLMDVQDRAIYNRSYTTGHKSYRARATIELGEAVGWEQAHSVLYAGVPDIAVGPRWYSTYEMACNVTASLLDGRDRELLANRGQLTREEAAQTLDLILHSHEPTWIHHLVGLLKGGTSARQILDVLQVGAAELILQTGLATEYSLPQHSYEYCNTLRWYYDTFEHPHQLKLLFVAASFVNQAAHHQAVLPTNGPLRLSRPRGVDALSQQQLLHRIDDAIVALQADESVALVDAYLGGSFDRAPLVELLANAACKLGNDPHNQEIGLCLVEDYLHSTAFERDRLLLACAKHTAGHRKYGDPLEAYRRYAETFGIATRQQSRGDAPIEALLLDD